MLAQREPTPGETRQNVDVTSAPIFQSGRRMSSAPGLYMAFRFVGPKKELGTSSAARGRRRQSQTIDEDL